MRAKILSINKVFSGKNRLILSIFFTIAFLAAAATRLFFVQIVQHSYYLELAKNQQEFKRVLAAERGDIYFKNKNGELAKAATTKVGATIYLNTKLLREPDAIFGKLNSVTSIDKDLFYKIVEKTNDPYEILKRRVGWEEAEKISALKLPGVGVEEERWRHYPGEALGGHVLGFVSSLDLQEEPSGKYGVEKYYDGALQGTRGSVSGDRDAKGFLIALTEGLKIDAAEGEDIVLTIEPMLQRVAEEEAAKLKTKWRAKSGGILIVAPQTGEIKALAGIPGFNPNEYQKEKDFGVFLNPFTEKIFELGSVFKPLTMAAAIDQGAVGPNTTYVDKGKVTISGRTIKNFDGKAHGERSMTQVLEESLNTGAVFAMQKIGGEKLKEYFHAFGLAEKTGVDLPGELRGDLSNLESGREIEFATASFGQGIAVTPLELAMALSTLANGGKLMQPYLKDGAGAQFKRQVITKETAETITRMLVDVVDMSLAGGRAKMPHYSIAAKTGTAQMPNVGGKGYSDEFLHSFFGYFPAYSPRFLILMFLERPQGVKYASQSMTDTFRALVEFLINYYTIPPDR